MDAVCKEEFACIVGRKLKSTDVPAEEVIDETHPSVDTTPKDDEEGLLTLDYSRLVIVLWGVCKDLSTRLNELENNMNQKAKKDTHLNTNMYVFCDCPCGCCLLTVSVVSFVTNSTTRT